jgi:hypothetical protein
MALVRVFNITNRAEVTNPPRAYPVARQIIRPGKFIEVDTSLLSSKDYALHGVALWIGTTLPAQLSTQVQRVVSPMTKEEAEKKLTALSAEELSSLALAVVPTVVFPAKASPAFRAKILLTAMFSGDRQLDPEKFFWLRRWKFVDGNFVEV